MRWLPVVLVALAACRVSDLVNGVAGGSRLHFTAQPTPAATGKAITPPVKVAVFDQAGRTDTAYGDSVALELAVNPGGARLSGRTVAAAERGIATFADLRLDRPGRGYVLRASAAGRAAATSEPFEVSADSAAPAPPEPPPPEPPLPPPPPPQASGLRFVVQPSNTGVNQPISPPVQVMVLDAQGNHLTSYTGAVTIDLASNPLGAHAIGTLTVNAVNGIATFVDVRVNLIGVDYRLRAAFAGATPIATSSAFAVLL